MNCDSTKNQSALLFQPSVTIENTQRHNLDQSTISKISSPQPRGHFQRIEPHNQNIAGPRSMSMQQKALIKDTSLRSVQHSIVIAAMSR